MDDSDQDFVDLCSKLLKRVRKKEYDNCILRHSKPQASTQPDTAEPSNRNKNDWRKKNDSKRTAVVNATQPASTVCGLDPTEPCTKVVVEHVERVVQGEEPRQSQETCPPVSTDPGASRDIVKKAPRPKDEVLFRMQQFKRVSPQKLIHNGRTKPTGTASSVLQPPQGRECLPEPSSSGLQKDCQTSDEELALKLQQELDREAVEVQAVDLEDQGLFFCQLCHRDLSHLTPEGRTHHINRCLDASEDSAPAPPPPSAVPDCPICGRRFKSQKSRGAHLKRCSVAMEVSPATLLQCVQRQAAEAQGDAINTIHVVGGSKRKGPSNPALPVRKKPRTKAQPLDEDTMVALALSSSLMQQEKQRAADRLSHGSASAFHISTGPQLKWRPVHGNSKGNKKTKGVVPRPPPFLLVQDPGEALARLQDRVAALLLQHGPPTAPTPSRRPSGLPARGGAAPLWQKSALRDGEPRCRSEFYTAELRGFLLPAENESGPPSTPESSLLPPAREDSSLCPLQSLTPSHAAPSPGLPASGSRLHIASQAIRDLMKLSEEGITLSQLGCCTTGPARDICLSGFVPEEPLEQAELCLSGFIPDPTCQSSQGTSQSQSDMERSNSKTSSLSRLASDLGSMVNNPQLSDVQLQVDDGQVYFAHSFMLYARCPLLAQMVHGSGFGAQEEGLPAARRVLMSDVPGEAVHALLQYLYTAWCPVKASMRPHVLELASRFDMEGLQQLCRLPQEETEAQGEDVGEEPGTSEAHGDQSFIELLRSVWDQGDHDDDGEPDEVSDGAGGPEKIQELSGGRGMQEEQVNEEEMEEIYEFAATQRQREDKGEEEEEEELQTEDQHVLHKPRANLPSPDSGGKSPQAHSSGSYSSLFSASWGVYEEDPSPPPKTQPPNPGQRPSPHKPPPEAVIDLSNSPVPVIPSSMPHLGPSPHAPPAAAESVAQGGRLSPKQESQGGGSICTPSSPVAPHSSREPEMIVLSDSSEETEGDSAAACSPSPSPPSPHPRLSLRNAAGASQPHPQVSTPDSENGDSRFAPNSESEAPCPDYMDPNPLDCSPELSWLIPGTPVHAGVSTSSISTQTHSSMRRTQLFPRAPFSSSSSLSLRSSGTLSRRTTPRGSHLVAQPGDDISGLEADRSSSDSTDLTGDKEVVFAAPQSPRQCSPTPVLQRHHRHPYSSTPLGTGSPRAPVPMETSPLSDDVSPPDGSMGPGSGLGDPRLSLSSSSSVGRGPPGPNGDGRLSGETRTKAERGAARGDEGTGAEAEPKEAAPPEGFESSFRHSFMDEPPMAFNDSWGLNTSTAAVDGDGVAGGVRFSLRLEDSGEGEEFSPQAASRPSLPQHRSTLSHATPSPPEVNASLPEVNASPPEVNNSLLDPIMWDSWEEGDVPPLLQRLNPMTQIKTPVSSRNRTNIPMVPITPMPSYSDMDTPELKNKLNRFGVRPLPKRQMVLKLKEIHQYTHQLADSDEDPLGGPAQAKDHPASAGPSSRPMFQHPTAPTGIAPLTHGCEDEAAPFSASQGSNTSEESQRSNPELCPSTGGSDSEDDVPASQAVSRLQERLQAVHAFILSDQELCSQILQYQPLVLAQLQARLRAAGIRLGAGRLLDYLDAQCITFTTARPGVPGRWRGGKKGRGAGKKVGGRGGKITAAE